MKIEKSEIVFKGSFLTVQRDQVTSPEGHRGQREYILHSGAALIIPLTDKGNVILIKQYRHPLKNIFWEFPAGRIDQQESSLETAKRELKEETGYSAETWNFLTRIHPCIGYSDEKIDIYLAQGLIAGDTAWDEDENLEVVEVPVNELMEILRRGELSDVKTQVAAFWLEKFLKGEWKL